MTTKPHDPANVLLQDAKTGKIPSTEGTLVLKEVIKNSAVMQLAKYEEMDGKPVKNFTFLAKGPGAYWVSEAERIQTSKMEWAQAKMEAKKLGVIIPFSKEFLRYTVQDFMKMAAPLIAEAFYRAFDQAVLIGTDSPWGTDKSILEIATAKQKVVTEGTGKNLYHDLADLLALVEADEHDPNGLLTSKSFKSKMRNVVDNNGYPMFDPKANDILGLPISYAGKDVIDKKKALALIGDWDYARYGILQNIEYAVSTDAQLSTIQGADGKPVNLFEQDMFALRATMEVAYLNVKDDAFAILKPKQG